MDKQNQVENCSKGVKLKPMPSRPCNFCNETAVIDGRTVYGMWADMCEKCHADYGVGIGTGRGSLIR